MAQTELRCDGVTVSTGAYSIDLNGSWDVDPSGEGDERAITVTLWQDYTQGYGTYQVDPDYGYKATLYNGYEELTPVTTGSYMDMGNGTFVFQATMTNGTTTYEVYLTGSTESSTPETNEMVAKNEVSFTCDKNGSWTIEALADDDSWHLSLELEYDEFSGEYNAYGNYVTDMVNWSGNEVAGTGQLYYDDFTGRQVFKATSLTDGSSEIYPVLYASNLNLETEQLMAGASWWNDFVGAEYYNVYLMDKKNSWELDLHVSGTGANGTYPVEVVSEEDEFYSTFNSYYKVLGELTIEDGMYDASVYTFDMNGDTAMYISCYAMQVELTEYTINVNNATVIEDLSQYGSSYSMTGEVELDGVTYPLTLDIADEVDLTAPSADLYVNLTVGEGEAVLGRVDGAATVTINGNTMAVAGTLEDAFVGVKFVFNISGALPTCPNIRLQTGSNGTLLAAVDGKNVNVTVARNFVAGDGFYTLCVPFDMPASVIGKAYQIASIKAYGAGAGVDVEFAEVTTILAGQPYLIEPAADTYGFTVNNVEIDNSTPAAVTVSGEGVSITMQGKYSRDAKTGGLYWVGNDGYLYNDDVWTTGLCAYFNISTPSGIAPRMRVVTSENATTGVDNTTTGAKVVKAIENGQLIINIDGVKYNIQGQKL